MNLRALRYILPSRKIWLHHELSNPNLYRAEGFNTVFRPLGWHHIVATVYQEAGTYLGYYGMWRTIDQKPYSSDDVAFLSASVPHISQGFACGPAADAN